VASLESRSERRDPWQTVAFIVGVVVVVGAYFLLFGMTHGAIHF